MRHLYIVSHQFTFPSARNRYSFSYWIFAKITCCCWLDDIHSDWDKMESPCSFKFISWWQKMLNIFFYLFINDLYFFIGQFSVWFFFLFKLHHFSLLIFLLLIFFIYWSPIWWIQSKIFFYSISCFCELLLFSVEPFQLNIPLFVNSYY